MVIIFSLIFISYLKAAEVNSNVAYRHYYTERGESLVAKEYLLHYLNNIKSAHNNEELNLENSEDVLEPNIKDFPRFDDNHKITNVPEEFRTPSGFDIAPIWDLIEETTVIKNYAKYQHNQTENMELQRPNHNEHKNHSSNLYDKSDERHESVVAENNADAHIKEIPLNDGENISTNSIYNNETFPKCPDGLVFYQSSDKTFSCYKITDPTTFPPPCPYPLTVDYHFFRNTYKSELTDKIVWAFAQKNTYNGAFEWINYIQNDSLIDNHNYYDYSKTAMKNCMVINGTQLTPVNCNEKYSGICIYSLDYSIYNDYCRRKFNATCFSSSLGSANKCYCVQEKQMEEQPSSTFCNKLAEIKDPYQNLLISNHLQMNQYCWIGLQKNLWISDSYPVKYSYWSNETNLTKQYGAIGSDGWILEDDGILSCAICEMNIENYNSTRLFLKRNLTNNKIQMEVYNPIETFQGVLCFAGGDTQFVNLSLVKDNYSVHDLWIDKDPVEDMWCKALQLPNLNLIYSNKIIGTNRNGNIFVAVWSFSSNDGNLTIDTCPLIKNAVIRSTKLIKAIELKAEGKIKIICHFYTVPNKLSILQEYNLLKNTQKFKNITLESLNSLHVCFSSTTTSGSKILHWPQTYIGSTAISDEICLQESDLPVTRTCGGNYFVGAEWLDVNGSCAEIPVSPKTILLDELLHTITPNINISKDLLQITENNTNINRFQIHLISQILGKIALSKAVDIKDVVSTVSNIMQFEPNKLRGSQKLLNSTDIILWSLDEILIHTDTTYKLNGYTSEGSEKLLVQATNLIQTDIKGFKLQHSTTQSFDPDKLYPLHEYPTENQFLEENLDLAVFVPQELRNDIINCAGSKNAPNILTSMFYDDVLFNENQNRTGKCDGRILSVLIPGFNCSFTSPLRVIFKSEADVNTQLKCASWVYGANELMESIHGHWSLENEPKAIGNSSYKLCEYSHTTHFGLLVLGPNTNISEAHTKALDIITAVGSALSILGLLIVFLTAILFKTYRATNGVVINFSVAMAAQIALLFIAGNIGEDKIACTIFGALLHYAILSEFFWMLTIAVLQYQRYVIIFSNPTTHLVAKSCIFAWGVPLLPIIVIVSISTDNYGRNSYGLCYALGNYFTFGVLLPVSLIILINLIIFLRIMVSIATSRRIKVHQERGNTSTLQLRLAFMLFFLLGLTWGFGLLAAIGGTVVYSYLFCLTATLQGFIVFLFFIALHEKTRSLWLNMKTCCRKSDDYDVTQDSATSVMMRRNKTTTTDTCSDSATSETLRRVRNRDTSEF